MILALLSIVFTYLWLRRGAAKAVKHIERSRETHVVWADHLREHPDAAFDQVVRHKAQGDVEFHEGCIRRYDHVLQVLKRLT